MSKKNTGDMFTTAREKAANDNELTKKMIDSVDAMLGTSIKRIRRINENWHLHNGQWPELDLYISDEQVLEDTDSNRESMNLNDFIVHHPKINNITNFILGDIITQPLIPIIKDFSSHGRKYREQAQLEKLQYHYYQNFYAPQEQMIRQQYNESIGNVDPMSLGPDEQKQMAADLQQRIKAAIPQSVMDDLKKIKTPDEKIRQCLLDYDLKAYQMEELFAQGGEQAVVTYEEYYRILRQGVRPTIESLNSKWVTWAASENCDYSEDGDLARYEQYLTPHAFIAKHGRAAIEDKNFMKNVQSYFTEVPGYFRDGAAGRVAAESNTFIENERDFVDAVGQNPGIIQHDWRTLMGQQEIAGLYSALSQHRRAGYGIRECYVVWKWTETITYVRRKGENGKEEEFFFNADYKRDKSRDIVYRKFPINRVYHGTKVAEKFYVDVGPVPWQYYGGVIDFQPKLTICGRRYSSSNGNDENNTLIGPAIQYQFRYNVSASKLAELEKRDQGKTVYWNTDVRPDGWSEEDYMETQIKVGNVPYTDKNLGQKKGTAPAHVIDLSNTSKMEEYRKSMDQWEREMYAACRINRDAIGEANQYQSNALTQSNIQGAAKQLLPFHNKRRLLKQRVLNYFNNLSMLCFLEDEEKQAMLLDDFSKLHLQVNAYDIKAHQVALFVVDDFSEAQNVERIKQQVLPLLQKPGTSVKDVIEFINSKTVPEMIDKATLSEIKTKEAEMDAHNRRMQEIGAQQQAAEAVAKYNKDRDEMIAERKNEVTLAVGKMQSEDKEKGNDVNKNKIADANEAKMMDIASKEKMNTENNQTKLQVEREKAAKTTA